MPLTTATLVQRAEQEGFVACGVAPADAAPESARRLREWLADGRHGTMIWMESRADERARPAALWPDVRSIVALGMSYAPGRDPLALADHPTRGRVSVYAQGGDYHKVVKNAAKRVARWMVEASGEQVKVFVDTAPVMEKPLAEAAGLGWQGKHTNLLSRAHGSWLFLGAIYTTATLEPSAPAIGSCGSCRACLDACPTDAFPAPGQLDARRCVSYLTIEHVGPIPHALRPGVGNRVYGCDDCLAVCPWNRFAEAARAHHAFLPRAELAAPRLADLMALDEEGFAAVFAGSPIKRIGRGRMARNAAVAAGNSDDPALEAPLRALLLDADPVVAEAAAFALDQRARRRVAQASASTGSPDGSRASR